MTPDECREGGNLFIGLAGQTCQGEPGSLCGVSDLGACCAGQTCTVTFQEGCAPPALWASSEPCYPGEQNPCLLTWGACCIGDQCYIKNSNTCPNPVGFHPGVPCVPDPCALPIERTTWGAIKHSYR